MTPLRLLVVVMVAGLAWFLGTDPMKLSPGAMVPDFRPQYIAPPPYDTLVNLPRDTASRLQNSELKWQGEFFGPESLLFDAEGRGPFTGVSDGRVLRYDGPELGWTTFAHTSTNRSDICAPKSPPAPNLAFEHICGRPLGLRFNKETGDLWIADAYFGIMKVGPEGGQAEVVLNEVDGVRLKFSNDLDFDHEGNLYFTDSSTRFSRRQFFLSIVEGDDTGRFIKYNPTTKEVTVLVDHLRFPNGVATSKDGTYVILAESRNGRLLKYWVKGEKAGRAETLVYLPGWPDNVRLNADGDFWVALHAVRNKMHELFGRLPWLRYLAVRLPIPVKHIYEFTTGPPHCMIVKYGGDGSVKEVLEDQTGKVVRLPSEVEEHNGKLYIGSVLLPHVAVYTLAKSTG